MKFVAFAQKYGKHVAVLVVGLVVGGFTMQMASASVPDSNGTIHGCRSNITTMLRVIDSASASCGADETGLNWDQGGVKGYAHVVRNANGTYSLDTANSKNISNLVIGPPNQDGFAGPFCMTLATTPRSVAVNAQGFGYSSLKTASGWTEGDWCSSLSSTANVGFSIGNDEYSFYITLF